MFYAFRPDEEINQGIVYILPESLKIRRCITLVHKNPEIAEDLFNVVQKWVNLLQDTKSSKSLQIKCSGIRKMLKDIPILESEKGYTKAVNHLVLCRIHTR